MKLKKLTAGVLLVLGSCMYAQAQQVVDLTTGRYANSAYIAYGTVDDNWRMVMPNGTDAESKVCASATNPSNGAIVWGGSSCSRWITPTIWNGTQPGSPVPSGTYEYYMTFILETRPCLPSSASAFFNVLGADNNVTGFKLNGYSYSLGPATADDFAPPLATNISLPLNAAHLVPGVNRVSIMVSNTSNWSGLNVCGSLTINFGKSPLVPTITGPVSFCAGTAPTFIGSDGPAGNAQTHLWESVECDANGEPIPGVANNFSWWYYNSPGNFSFPANLFTCGKYYRIKLATTAPCEDWTETRKVVYISCIPSAAAGADRSICQGSCTSIGLFGSSSYGYNWTYVTGGLPGGLPNNTAFVTVCPQSTTTYTVTKTNIHGCAGRDEVTVTVVPNNPAFSTYINTSNPSYFTVEATPNVLNSQPGYRWAIEELVSNVAPYTAYYGINSNTANCWLTYPTQKFIGFTSLAGGSYTQAVCGTPPAGTVGRFLYNHTYRITLTTWNGSCVPDNFSTIITPVKSMGGGTPTMQVIEGVDTPDFDFLEQGNTASVNEAPELEEMLKVFPNPSTGIYTVSLANITEGAVDVFDMTGKKVLSRTLRGEGTISFDLTGFSKGVYVVNLHADGKLYSQKVVLE